MKKENTTTRTNARNEAMEEMQKATENVCNNVLDRATKEFAETDDNNKQSECHCLVKVTVQTLINALSKIEDNNKQSECHCLVKVTVQTLINALSKIEDKEQYVVISQEHDHFTYLQSVYGLTDQIEEDDKVVVLVDSIEKLSKYFTPNKVL